MLSALFGNRMQANVHIPVREWVEANIDLSKDPTAEGDDYIKLDPWQVAPLEAQFDARVRMVVVVAVEQIGKSTLWRMPMAYRMRFIPAPRMVIYESDEKAEDINRDTFDPLIQSIPDIAGQIVGRANQTRRSYHLRNGGITYFGGAGVAITSKPMMDGVADELDQWYDGVTRLALQNLRNFRKRFRTYWRKNKGCLTVVSSPRNKTGDTSSAIWTVFEGETSEEYWTLRCKQCNGLTMRACDTHHLQWEMENERLLPDSIRLICPACGREHEEAEAFEITNAGAYKAEHPEIVKYRGFQQGALGVPRVFGWQDIAEAQLDSGRSASMEAQIDFDNSWRGVNWRPRRTHKPTEENIKTHAAPPPDPENVANYFFAADTQDSGFYWVVLALTPRNSVYIIAHGFVETVNFEELEKPWDAEYNGQLCVMGCVDEGGHHGTRVYKWAEKIDGMYSYKGNSRIGAPYKRGKPDLSRLLVMPDRYKAELLYRLHSHADREQGYLFLPEQPGQQLVTQLGGLQPNNDKKHGNHYENWESNGNDHYFDAVKMGLALIDFAKDTCKEWLTAVPWCEAEDKPERQKPEMEDL